MKNTEQLLDSRQKVCIRRTRYADLPYCLSLLPEWLDLDNKTLSELPRLWHELLHQSAFTSDVLVDMDLPTGKQLIGMGMSLALTSTWAQYFRDQPAMCAGRTLYRALINGEFRLPGDVELGEMNARGEVFFLILHYRQLQDNFTDAESVAQLTLAGEGFRQSHSGFRLREFFVEGRGRDLDYLQTMGFNIRTHRNDADGKSDHIYPELCGLSREETAMQMPGTHARDIFQFNPPIFGFTAAERRMLRLVVTDNLSDKEICDEFSLSSHTVKKQWTGIYQRVQDVQPDFFGAGISAHQQQNVITRGPEKRRVLLSYLQQHFEELRPFNP